MSWKTNNRTNNHWLNSKYAGIKVFKAVKNSFFSEYVYEPPPLDLYIKFSLKIYFMVFWGILFVQAFTIFVIDKIWVKTIPATCSMWERLIHAMEKSHFSFPYLNWHEGEGDCKEHMNRKNAVQHEVIVTTVVNLFFNMLMLIPLVILCKYELGEVQKLKPNLTIINHLSILS